MTDNFIMPFTGSGLDSHEDQRSPDHIKAYLDDPKARIVLLHKGDLGLHSDFTLLSVHPRDITQLNISPPDLLFLGCDATGPVFAVSLTTLAHPLHAHDFHSLRHVGGRLSIQDLAISGYAKSLLDWHYNHPFCAKCGQGSDISEGGIKRICRTCETEHFPRVNPVAIMLAVHDDQCLLGRGPHWPPGFFSALAGFVSPGESLEECCIREVREEVGLTVHSPRYVFSQPWPFPSQLMMGLICHARTQDIQLNTAEVSEAIWVSRNEVQAVFDKTGDRFMLPPRVTIAHQLLKYWLQDTA